MGNSNGRFHEAPICFVAIPVWSEESFYTLQVENGLPFRSSPFLIGYNVIGADI